jgi:hypothetical protein
MSRSVHRASFVFLLCSLLSASFGQQRTRPPQVVFRSDNDAFSEATGEVGSNFPMPIILSSAQSSVTSDGLGMASPVPSAGAIAGPIEIEIMATAGTNAVQQFEVESIWTNVGVADVSPGGPDTLREHEGTDPIKRWREKNGFRRIELLPY